MKPLSLLTLLLALTLPQTVTAQRHHVRKHKLFRSVDVEYWNTTDSIILGGTLTLPNQREKRFPAVILISGSGRDDRDYTINKSYKMFREIAEYLSARGIAVLRVDDRGAGKTGFKGPGYFNPRIKASLSPLIADITQDVQFGVSYLKKRPDINTKRIGLLGHSLGGIIAPAVLSQTSVAFIISIASPIVTGKEFAIEQSRNSLLDNGLDSQTVANLEKHLLNPMYDLVLNHTTEEQVKKRAIEITQQVRKNVDKVSFEKISFGKSTDEDLKLLIVGNATIPEMSEIILANPVIFWTKVNCPSLSVFAGCDRKINSAFQISKLNELINKIGVQNHDVFLLPEVDHFFQNSEKKSNLISVRRGHQISSLLLKIIFTWLKAI